MRGLAIRAVLVKGSREFIPLYALYALLFADHGLNTAQISSLLALWSVTSFVLEVPSGAWADTVSRRLLLVGSGALVAAAFTLWTVTPSYLGFALGFVLWGVSSALESGTFEALVYDSLAAEQRTDAYPRIMGYARAAAESTVVVAILAAAPLYALGGYALVGWVSVAIAVAHTAICLLLPDAPRSAGEPEDTDDAEPTTIRRYLTMLRAGLGETMRVRRVRRGVVLVALLFGITAYDEYFALLAQSAGVSTTVVPVLIGITVVGSMTGTLLAGRTSSLPARTLARMVGVGGVLFVGGSLVAGAAAGRPELAYPLAVAGFVAIAAGYGTMLNAEVVADARLQDAIEGPARATVTSVSGLLAEVVSLAVFGVAALAGVWLSMSVTLALLGTAVLVIAALMPGWLPRRRARVAGTSE
ncbi:MFS transporter [Nocardia farcinica]|uniref:MFS transporter n=1 Tax=Nocardia farcinica TaxID=37329 RepID=UPI0024563B07|nr:MFS transporter [Nocardia farcinica]